MTPEYFTIGHSNRSGEAFIDLLRRAGVTAVADVRKLPGSRANPQFDADALAAALAQTQIAYEHIAELGGRRGRTPEFATSPNPYWENRSFRNYADYAMTDDFQIGMARLRQLARIRTVAIMCSEAVWWRCHRRFIADYLLASGDQVFHILGPDNVPAATLTPSARLLPDGSLTYPTAEASTEP